MSDHELLELAAKAAGIKVPEEGPWGGIDANGVWKDVSPGGDGARIWRWNPLTHDGDALRLAVKLELRIMTPCMSECDPYAVVDDYDRNKIRENSDDGDIYSATRRAIVRAAAEIGKSMQESTP